MLAWFTLVPLCNPSELAFSRFDLLVFYLLWLYSRQFLARIQGDRGKSVFMSYHHHLSPSENKLQEWRRERGRRKEYNDLVVASSHAQTLGAGVGAGTYNLKYPDTLLRQGHC